MTRYILNSGGLKGHPEKAKLYTTEIFKGLGQKPNILLCFFAQMREDWENQYQEYLINFKNILPDDINPTFDLAFPEKFTEQVKASDAIIFSGGDDHLVQYWLKQFDLINLWQNKTIATNSASSDAIAKSFWACDWRQNKDGLGLVPIKFIAHYKSSYGADDPRGSIDWEKAYSELEKYGDTSLPIYALEEGDYIVIEK